MLVCPLVRQDRLVCPPAVFFFLPGAAHYGVGTTPCGRHLQLRADVKSLDEVCTELAITRAASLENLRIGINNNPAGRGVHRIGHHTACDSDR